MRSLVLIISILFSATLWAQKSFVANPHGHSIFIGEPLTIDLTAHASASDSLKWPLFNDTVTGGLEVLAYRGVDTFAIDGGMLEYNHQLVITGFDSGLFAVPPIPVIIGSDTLESEAFLVEVKTVEVDTTQPIKDIIDPSEVPFGWEDFLYYAKKYGPYALALSAILFFIVWLIARQRKSVEQVEEKIPAQPAFIIATERLDDLEKRETWQRGEYKLFYLELSNIVRECLELQWGINALEATTGEIIRDVSEQDSLRSLRQALHEFLSTADMAKFAKAKPLAEVNMQSIKLAREIAALAKQEHDAKQKEAAALKEKEGGHHD